MPRKPIPKGWNNVSCYGNTVDGSKLIAFKTPLNETVFTNRPSIQKWAPADTVNAIPNLGMIVNLCYATMPYYYARDFENLGVQYENLACVGKFVPDEITVVRPFQSRVNDFLADEANKDSLIGVHCTHGVNRTGYVICCYLIDCLGFDPEVAIREFERARGHPIERENYLEALRARPFEVGAV